MYMTAGVDIRTPRTLISILCCNNKGWSVCLWHFVEAHQRHRQCCILVYSTGRRYLCSLRYILCTYAYNKLLMAWEGVLYAEYSTRDRVSRTIQDEAKPSAVLFYNYYILYRNACSHPSLLVSSGFKLLPHVRCASSVTVLVSILLELNKVVCEYLLRFAWVDQWFRRRNKCRIQ